MRLDPLKLLKDPLKVVAGSPRDLRKILMGAMLRLKRKRAELPFELQSAVTQYIYCSFDFEIC